MTPSHRKQYLFEFFWVNHPVYIPYSNVISYWKIYSSIFFNHITWKNSQRWAFMPWCLGAPLPVSRKPFSVFKVKWMTTRRAFSRWIAIRWRVSDIRRCPTPGDGKSADAPCMVYLVSIPYVWGGMFRGVNDVGKYTTHFSIWEHIPYQSAFLSRCVSFSRLVGYVILP